MGHIQMCLKKRNPNTPNRKHEAAVRAGTTLLAEGSLVCDKWPFFPQDRVQLLWASLVKAGLSHFPGRQACFVLGFPKLHACLGLLGGEIPRGKKGRGRDSLCASLRDAGATPALPSPNSAEGAGAGR